MENKTINYLKYAIGEIVLVVIGILLAIQINMLSNRQVAKKDLRDIYTQIQAELRTDTTRINVIRASFDDKEKRIQDIIDGKISSSFYDTINELNFSDCSICRTESTNYDAFRPVTKGYTLLKEAGVLSAITTDSLLSMIDDLYTQEMPRIEQSFLLVQSIAFENIKDNQQYAWYVDWTQRRYNKDFLIYLFESEDYRKQLGRYMIYMKFNFIADIGSYKTLATQILEKLELELKE